MHRIEIKPLSVNEAWKGRRYKTDKYKRYQRNLLYLLPRIKLPEPPYAVYYEFGFSSAASDIDNPVKLLQDILQKKYSFDDKHVHEMLVRKYMVKKGNEYIRFKIEHLEQK